MAWLKASVRWCNLNKYLGAAALAALVLVAGCARSVERLVVPNFQMEQISPNEYQVRAGSLGEMLLALQCGEKGTCVVQGGGQIYIVQLDPHTILIQVPLKNSQELIREIKALGFLALIDPQGRIFVTAKKP